MLTIILIAGMVLATVSLIEDVLMLIKIPAHDDVLVFQLLLLKATPPPVISSNTVPLAAERGPANTIMAMIKWSQESK